MDNQFNMIQELLIKKAELNAKLALLPYDGTPEVKEISGKKYLYVRKRELGKLKSEYVDIYSEELHNLLLRNAKEAKSLRKEIRRIERELASFGYSNDELEPNVLLNLDFARKNMKAIIYDQAILEGCATTFPDTETIIDNGKVNIVGKKMTAKEMVEKAVNSKIGKFTKNDIAELCPEISKGSVEQTLKKLCDEGKIKKEGVGKATFYHIV